jgi:hypothetical protein
LGARGLSCRASKLEVAVLRNSVDGCSTLNHVMQMDRDVPVTRSCSRTACHLVSGPVRRRSKQRSVRRRRVGLPELGLEPCEPAVRRLVPRVVRRARVERGRSKDTSAGGAAGPEARLRSLEPLGGCSFELLPWHARRGLLCAHRSAIERVLFPHAGPLPGGCKAAATAAGPRERRS